MMLPCKQKNARSCPQTTLGAGKPGDSAASFRPGCRCRLVYASGKVRLSDPLPHKKYHPYDMVVVILYHTGGIRLGIGFGSGWDYFWKR